MTANDFKVIIVGGGPVGLTAAHALRLAGIDFLMLEARDSILADVGASMFLGAGSLRIIHQFGLLEKLNAVSNELRSRKIMTVDGTTVKDTAFFPYINRNHGTAPRIFNRADFIRILYEGLPDTDRAKVLTGKRLTDIVTNDHGVKVTCSDGSTYEGSMVLGADGVHSKTRSIMRKLALESDANREWDPETPFTTTYKGMWFCFPKTDPEGQVMEIHHKDHTTMCISGRQHNWILITQKLPKPTKDRSSFTEKDIQECIETFAEYPIVGTLKVKDLYAQRIKNPIMAHLEEGLINHRVWGRILLVGDASAKFTPHAGLNYQNSVQSVAHLCNKLHEALAAGGLQSSSALTEVFQSHEASRSGVIKADSTVSQFMVRLQAWATPFHHIISRYILTWTFTDSIFISFWGDHKALVLDYVAAEEPFHGARDWEHKMPKPGNPTKG